MHARLATIVLVGLLRPATVAADIVLLFDNFDGYADQAAFNNAWPAWATQPSGSLTTEQAASVPHSVKFAAIDTPQSGNAQRNQRFFPETGLPSPTNLIHFEFDFYDTDAAAQPYRQNSAIIDSSGPTSGGGLIQLGLNNNQTSTQSGGNYYMARIVGYDPIVDGEQVGGPSAFFKLNGPGAPLRSTGWHTLAVTIGQADFKFYVDGVLARTVMNRWTLRSYDEIRIGSGLSNGGHAAYVDNVKVWLSGGGVDLTGDYNQSGVVEAADYIVWRKNVGTQNTLPNDPIGGTIGMQQYNNWVTHFGRSTISSGAASQIATPEPSSLALFFIPVAVAALRRPL